MADSKAHSNPTPSPASSEDTRRRFLSFYSGVGLGGTLLPGVLWAQLQQNGAQRITQPMLAGALALSGLTFSEEDQRSKQHSLMLRTNLSA